MPDDFIQNWLRKKIAWHITSCWAGAVLALLAGVIGLFIIFWLAYLVLLIGEEGVSSVRELFFSKKFHLSHNWRLVISGLFLAALFLEWLRRSPNELGNYAEVNTPPGSQALVLYAGAMGAFTMLLANPQASSTIITEILYVGPRLILGSISLIRDASRWRRINVPDCAWVLQWLISRGSAVTNDEFCANLNDQDWAKLKHDVAQIPGVVCLEKGLSLTDDFRREILTQMSIA